MSASFQRAQAHLRALLHATDLDDLRSRMRPEVAPVGPRARVTPALTPAAIEQRWTLLSAEARAQRDELRTGGRGLAAETYPRNIENFIGTVKLPVGLAGPLRVRGSAAQGDFYVPLATTEAALVASYTRGSLLISESGGCAALVLAEGVSRAPGFIFRTLAEAGDFVAWALLQQDAFVRAAAATTRHGQLVDLRVTIEGNHVYLCFEFTTGDAAGQNMVTIATQAICEFIAANSPVRPRHVFVEANLSGDKKASAQSFQSVRGRKVSAEALIPAAVLRRRLHTDAATMEEYWRMSAIGSVLSGTIGVQGHYANGLAALFIATGQDVACVSEAAVGVTRFEAAPGGALYAAVTLPNLIVGTVGGGTGLPSQAAGLEILGLRGEGKVRALAEVAAALALAGELSIIGALSAGHFAQAHEKLARGRKRAAP